MESESTPFQAAAIDYIIIFRSLLIQKFPAQRERESDQIEEREREREREARRRAIGLILLTIIIDVDPIVPPPVSAIPVWGDGQEKSTNGLCATTDEQQS